MDEIAEFFPRRHIVNQNIVIEEEALQFLNDVILHIARRIRKNPIGFMDEGTGPIKIKIADLIDSLGIKSIQPFQGMGIILERFRLFPFEEQLEFAKAFEAQFLCKADNGRRRYIAGSSQLVNRTAANLSPVLYDILPDTHIGII